MTLVTFQDGQIVMRDGKVGTGEECCCPQCTPCECGWLFSGTYDYELTITCNGNPVTQTGQIVNGVFVPADEPSIVPSLNFCVVFATNLFCADPGTPCTYSSGTIEPEGWDGCCENRVSLVGEYTLNQLAGGDCTGAGATATLTIL